MSLREFRIDEFGKGLVTSVEDSSIPENAASSELNWLSLSDKIELSGGYDLVGADAGAGSITGLFVAEKKDGSKLRFRSRGRKVEYYDGSAWTEIGTDILGAAADGETVFFTQYDSLAGYQVWFGSKSAGPFKCMVYAPADAKDMYDSSKNFHGLVKAKDGRMWLWHPDRNYVYGSYLDAQDSSVYTAVTAEAVGSSGSASYSGTLAAVTGKRTCFGVVVTDGTLTLTDQGDGTLSGNGTGTVNYATGAYSVTFSGVTTGAVTANYSWENSTSNGIADFTFSATRTAGQGFFLPQASGGPVQNVLFYNGDAYAVHRNETWRVSIGPDDTTVTNKVHRVNVGISSPFGAHESGEGIWIADYTNPSKPSFSLLSLDGSNAEVVPVPYSLDLDLSGYDLSRAAVGRFGDYVVFLCAQSGLPSNNRMFAYNRVWRAWDVLEYYGNCLAADSDDLLVGDSATANVYLAFSGHTANGANVRNHWAGKLSRLGLDELKKFKRLTVRGYVGTGQTINVAISYDGNDYSDLGDIEATGDYVDTGASLVGASMVGSESVGGGATVSAFWYVREFRVRSDVFDEAKVRFEATGTGYASVTSLEYYDVQARGQKNLIRYRQTS